MLFGILILAVVIFLLSRDSSEFSIFIVNGKITKVTGRVSAKIQEDFENAIKSVRKGSVKGYKSGTGVSLRFSGIDEGTQQRLRNIVGLYHR